MKAPQELDALCERLTHLASLYQARRGLGHHPTVDEVGLRDALIEAVVAIRELQAELKAATERNEEQALMLAGLRGEVATVKEERERLDALIFKLCTGAAHKYEPWDSEHNTALILRGDMIHVSEGDLWALLPYIKLQEHGVLRSELEKYRFTDGRGNDITHLVGEKE